MVALKLSKQSSSNEKEKYPASIKMGIFTLTRDENMENVMEFTRFQVSIFYYWCHMQTNSGRSY